MRVSLNSMQQAPERYPDMTVRPMEPKDIGDCAAIVGETPLWKEHYGLTSARAETIFAGAMDRKEGLLVAEEVNSVIGFAWFTTRGGFARSGYLRLIGVRADRRNGHAGAALLQAVESAVGDDLFILVSDFNTDARRFYKRHGYEEVGQLPGYILPGVAEIILWRRK